MAKLAACIPALPPTALRVVIVGVGSSGLGDLGGLEAELGGEVLDSPLWTDSPERTIVFAPRYDSDSPAEPSRGGDGEVMRSARRNAVRYFKECGTMH